MVVEIWYKIRMEQSGIGADIQGLLGGIYQPDKDDDKWSPLCKRVVDIANLSAVEFPDEETNRTGTIVGPLLGEVPHAYQVGEKYPDLLLLGVYTYPEPVYVTNH